MSLELDSLQNINEGGLLNYEAEDNPTLDSAIQDYFKNQNLIMRCLTARLLWQPSTEYDTGAVVHSPNMPAGFMAIAIQTATSTSGTAEPAWGTTEASQVVDNGVTWEMHKIIYGDKFCKRAGDYTGITETTTLTAAQSGSKIQVNTAGITITTPAAAAGLHYTIYNASAGNITLATLAEFLGVHGSGGTTQSLAAGNSVDIYSDGANWIVTNLETTVSSSGITMQKYTTPGSYTWTCPTGVTSILVTVIGAGGGGGSGYALTSDKCAGGGGGGNIIRDYPYPVTPGANYTVIVGAGGSGCEAPNSISENSSFTASAGGSSSFDSLTAFGGNYGGNQAGLGGVGRLSLGYDSTLDAFRTLNDGGNGGSYDNIHGHGGGQFGGTCGTNTSAATNGRLGSGGGGGSCRDGIPATYRTGGNGGPGMVIIKY